MLDIASHFRLFFLAQCDLRTFPHPCDKWPLLLSATICFSAAGSATVNLRKDSARLLQLSISDIQAALHFNSRQAFRMLSQMFEDRLDVVLRGKALAMK